MGSSGRSITTTDILNGTIATADLGDAQVTTAKLAVGMTGRFYSVVIPPKTITGVVGLTTITGSNLNGVVTVGNGLLVGLSMYGFGSAAAFSGAQVALYESAVNLGLLFNEYAGASLYVSKTSMILVAPSAGSHDYYLSWSNPTTTALTWNGALLWALELR